MRTRAGFASFLILSGIASSALGQAAAEPAPVAPPTTPEAASAPPPPAAQENNSAGANASFTLGSGIEGSSYGVANGSPNDDAEYRRKSLNLSSSITGSTGLLRVTEAGAGAPGTFRLQLLGHFFTGSDFLCGKGGVRTCAPTDNNGSSTSDEATRLGANLSLSVSLFSFLEAYGALYAVGTSNDQGRPELLQVLGDGNVGVKAFTPYRAGRLLSFGGEGQVFFHNGTGGVGLTEGDASFALRALASADFSNTERPESGLPLRVHLNAGYLFDNTASVVSDTEKQRNARISRIERFGLDVNYTDSLQLGLGVEGTFEVIRPFVEYTADIPVNRQEYRCVPSRTLGEGCLKDEAGFDTTPQRLTVGARVQPWAAGLTFTAAADIGLGATSKFIEEVAPELPWNLWLGVSYAYDTQGGQTRTVEVERVVQLEPPPPSLVMGRVVDKESRAPLADAVLKFEGRPLTGLVTTQDGTFATQGLEPGEYLLNVSAPGYRTGQCRVVVAPPAQPAPPPAAGAPAPPAPPPQVSQVECELEAMPKVGTVVGNLNDSDGGNPISGAHVRITDALGRELELNADSSGAFRFENVVPGKAKLTVTAPNYFTSVTEWEVKALEEVQARISLNKRPEQANVVVAKQEVQLRKQVHFETNSAVISPDSMALLEEIADVLRTHTEIKSLEIQGHTDNTGTPDYNKRLSNERAEAVRQALVTLGVEASRLSASGYGQEKPLVPNTSDANRAKNRRVQLMIQN